MTRDEERLKWEEKQRRVREVIEKRKAWTHIAMHYVIKMVTTGGMKRRKDGSLNRQRNVERLVSDLADALDYDVKGGYFR